MLKIPRIIYNDDSCSLSIVDPQLHNKDNISRVFDYLDNTRIDRICWSVYGAWASQNWYSNRIENYFDLAEKTIGYSSSLLKYNLMYALYKQNIDYLPILIDECHQRDKEFYASFRMNDCHLKSEPDGASAALFWRNNQDKRLWEITIAKSYYNALLDYSYPEVRDNVFNAIDEFVSRYDVDGIELDFLRQEWAFNPSEAWGKRQILTDLIAKIRTRLQAGNVTGRVPGLMVRVPATASGRVMGGFDLEAWMLSGLVDLVVGGVQNLDYSVDLNEMTAMGKKYHIPVFGDIEAFPILTFTNQTELTSEQSSPSHNYNPEFKIGELECAVYALADILLNHCRVDGLYMFNFPCWRNEIILKHTQHSPAEMATFQRLLTNIGSDTLPAGIGERYYFWTLTPVYAEALRPAKYHQTIHLHLGKQPQAEEQVIFSMRIYAAPNPHALLPEICDDLKKLLHVRLNGRELPVLSINCVRQAAGLIPSGYTIGDHELWSFELSGAALGGPKISFEFEMPDYPRGGTPYIYIHDLQICRRNY
ncbi:MAG: family 10 glycosylhydrolase [Victivallaceae bacterium]|jgi:hypothetical protein